MLEYQARTLKTFTDIHKSNLVHFKTSQFTIKMHTLAKDIKNISGKITTGLL